MARQPRLFRAGGCQSAVRESMSFSMQIAAESFLIVRLLYACLFCQFITDDDKKLSHLFAMTTNDF